MSEQIDWSKAPDSAMVLLKHVRDNSYAWAVSHAEESDAWMVDGTCFGFRLMANCWRVVSNRPTTPSWSGEGLPPVGVVCEVLWDSPTNTYYPAFVCGEDDGQAVYRWVCGPDKGAYRADTPRLIGFKPRFRPIRTPEQIAADEREAAIRSMLSGFDSAKSWLVSDLAGFIYDKGYRKP